MCNLDESMNILVKTPIYVSMSKKEKKVDVIYLKVSLVTYLSC